MRRTILKLDSNCVVLLSMLILPTVPAQAAEVRVTTAKGRGADIEVRKNRNMPLSNHDSGHGTDQILNIRHDPTVGRERNEVVLLRFDLSDLTKVQIENARLELTAASTFNKNKLQVYGLKHTAKNQIWDEPTLKFSSAPGLKWNGKDLTTRDLVPEDTIRLGIMNAPAAHEGVVLRFTSDSLVRFLQDERWRSREENPGVVTLILMLDEPSRGQRRFCSKEFADQDDQHAPQLVILAR